MTIARYFKDWAKALIERHPMLEAFARRHVWRIVHPRGFFHEPEMRYFYRLPKGSVDFAVDVGAAMGTYCWILERSAKRIIAFEPGRVHNASLTKATRGSKIDVVRAAVGATPGVVRLFTPNQASSGRFLASVATSNPVTRADDSLVDEVEQVTLDDYLGRNIPPGRTVDILKVDVEGYELEVFKGAADVLKRHHPLVICEIEARHNPDYGQVFDILRREGYAVFIYRDGGFIPFTQDRIEPGQRPADLEQRMSGKDTNANAYVNNFIFEHPRSRIKVSTSAPADDR